MYRQIYLIVLVVISLNNSTTLSEISKKPNRFLTHIFNKYGSHGVINFEVSRARRCVGKVNNQEFSTFKRSL